MSSCVLAVEPAVSEETEEPYLSHLPGTLFPWRLGKEHTQQEIVGESAPSEHNQTIDSIHHQQTH